MIKAISERSGNRRPLESNPDALVKSQYSTVGVLISKPAERLIELMY